MDSKVLSRRLGRLTTVWFCLVSKMVACWIFYTRYPSSTSVSLFYNDALRSFLLVDSNSSFEKSSSSSLGSVDAFSWLVSPPSLKVKYLSAVLGVCAGGFPSGRMSESSVTGLKAGPGKGFSFRGIINLCRPRSVAAIPAVVVRIELKIIVRQ
jgi:hypothetical protein